MFEPHLEIFSPAQAELWPELTQIGRMGFTLYGGTAIALRCGHRHSFDFDFFTEQKLDVNLLVSELSLVSGGQTIQQEPNTLTIRMGSGVLISFFCNLNFGRVGVPEVTADTRVPVASSIDLLATKLKVMLQRAEMKDYADVAALLRSGQNLRQGYAAALALFGRGFPIMESLRALTWFEDGNLSRVEESDRELLRKASVGVVDDKIPTIRIVSRSLNNY